MAPRAKTAPQLHALIREGRIAAGISQDQLGARVGTNQSTVSGWERDEACPDVVMLDALATALNVDRNDLIDAALDYDRRFRAGKTSSRRTPGRRHARPRS